MRVLFLGTYDARQHPRVRVMQEGMMARGHDVVECNAPLDLPTADRVRMLRRPWLALALAARLVGRWRRLAAKARALLPADAVLVPYMGHFDVHFARRIASGAPVVLDHFLSARDTAVDRGFSSRPLLALLERLDRAAAGAADIVFVDTEGQLDLLTPEARERAVVVPIGAPDDWFSEPHRSRDSPLRVVFYGLYTPLQGAPLIGEAISILAGTDDEIAFTMIGRGQDAERTRALAGDAPAVTWREWVEPEEIRALVASHDVCLGIFGTSPKALRVVPNKLYQGAAAGCAIVTSDTPSQRRALGDAGVFVRPGDARGIADALATLARDRERVWELRRAAFLRAEEAFRPRAVVESLHERLIAGAA